MKKSIELMDKEYELFKLEQKDSDLFQQNDHGMMRILELTEERDKLYAALELEQNISKGLNGDVIRLMEELESAKKEIQVCHTISLGDLIKISKQNSELVDKDKEIETLKSELESAKKGWKESDLRYNKLDDKRHELMYEVEQKSKEIETLKEKVEAKNVMIQFFAKEVESAKKRIADIDAFIEYRNEKGYGTDFNGHFYHDIKKILRTKEYSAEDDT
jgi:chromosome segregation ATPase